MRTSEWIQISFAFLLAAVAWLRALLPRPLPVGSRWAITLLAAVPVVAVALARTSEYVLSPQYVSILRDWLTAALFLVPYWQTGEFFPGPNLRIQERLAAFDRWLLPGIAETSGTARTALGFSLEIAYLFCYPMVPLGLLVLYAVGGRGDVAYFWFVVLISTYICYAATPFFPAFPPRAPLGEQVHATQASPGRTNPVRIFNRWILRHGSIHAISFPSAHVASALAVSFVLMRVSPRVGLLFLALSVWIAVGAVVGRYHYALDVLLGAVTALAVFTFSYKCF